MKIFYSIRTLLSVTIEEGYFDADDDAAVCKFAKRTREAWAAGHIVTTVKG